MSGTHKHKCRNSQCGHIWEHSDDMAGDRPAHTCAKCGETQFTRFYDNDAPTPADGFLRALARLVCG